MEFRSLSNVLYAFGDMMLRQTVLSSYSELFDHCQVPVALHLRENKNIKEQDLIGIIVGYSKAQAMGPEFKHVLELVDHSDLGVAR